MRFRVAVAQVLLLAAIAWRPADSAVIVKAYVSGNANEFYTLNVASGAMTAQPTAPGFFHMDFTPAGILYAVSRGTDALYRIDAPGSATFLRSIGVDSIGGGFTVSNDGQYAYFTNPVSVYDRTDVLYRYHIGTGQLQSLGAISGAFGISDIEFGLDGTLYAVTGLSLVGENCSITDAALYSIDVNTRSGTKLGPSMLGLDVGCRTSIPSLDVTADGVMQMLITPATSCCGNRHYFGTIDVATGLGAVDYSRWLTIDGRAFTSGATVALYSVVPLPTAFWCLGSALLAMMGRIRRRR